MCPNNFVQQKFQWHNNYISFDESLRKEMQKYFIEIRKELKWNSSYLKCKREEKDSRLFWDIYRFANLAIID